MTMPSPVKGAVVGVNFTQNQQIRTELYIDSGDGEVNARIFAALQAHMAEVEERFGEPMSWEPLPNRRACRIAVYAPGDVTQSASYEEYISWFIEVGTRFRAALAPYAPAVAAALSAESLADT
jgi:hypothetical protein